MLYMLVWLTIPPFDFTSKPCTANIIDSVISPSNDHPLQIQIIIYNPSERNVLNSEKVRSDPRLHASVQEESHRYLSTLQNDVSPFGLADALPSVRSIMGRV